MLLSPDTFVNLHLVSDSEIRRLNKKYRQQDQVTDVLSFPINQKLPDGRYYLGDVVISLPTANKNASSHGSSLERELGSLAEHGFLHLLGVHHRGDD